jgi:SsrA-binding protein
VTTYADNKKAKFDYEFIDEYEGGVELFGHEVKAIKTKGADLSGSHIVIRGGEAFLVGATIPEYQTNNIPKDYKKDRTRKILLTKKEIAKLAEQEAKKGLTLVPISLYNKRSLVKISFAVAKGKKKFDKRETIKKRDADREMERTLKKYR